MSGTCNACNGFWMAAEAHQQMQKNKPAVSWLDLVRKTDHDLLALCRVDTFRGSGRGGQKRNKTANAVRLTYADLAVTASGSRSKAQNLSDALRKLRIEIALSTSEAIGRSPDAKGLPESVLPYIDQGIIRINPKNPHFPELLGGLFDLFLRYRGQWIAVADACGVSPSQLRRFVETHATLAEALGRMKRGS